ncbi:MAG: helix-turn-helix domain-containing protein [Armatimonadetes bacterium]|nr:helix-turn-helix domain-containing protein [Armatimonadota bacterium]
MSRKPGRTSDALEIIDRMIGDDPEMRRMLVEEELKLQIAQLVYDAREAASLTRQQLAKRAGTPRGAIAALEDADYDGPLVPVLTRIATALDMRVELRLLPLSRPHRRRRSAAAT